MAKLHILLDGSSYFIGYAGAFSVLVYLSVSMLHSGLLRIWKKAKNNSKVVAVMWLSLVVFASGLLLISCAWYHSTCAYVRVYFGFVMCVLFRRAVWCTCIHCIFGDKNFLGCFTKGHEEPTSTNVISCFILYFTQQYSWRATTYCGYCLEL